MTSTSELLLQGVLFLFAILIFFFLQSIPKQTLSRLRNHQSSSTSTQSRRHFFAGAHLLSRSLSSSSSSSSPSLLHSALTEANLSISLSPRDPASHILKAVILNHQNHPIPALKSLDTALSPPQVKSLSKSEKADALVKRAEIQLRVKNRRRVELAVADLEEAMRICESGKGWCLLGECYEGKKMLDEARKAYQTALKIDRSFKLARDGIRRLDAQQS